MVIIVKHGNLPLNCLYSSYNNSHHYQKSKLCLTLEMSAHTHAHTLHVVRVSQSVSLFDWLVLVKEEEEGFTN